MITGLLCPIISLKVFISIPKDNERVAKVCLIVCGDALVFTDAFKIILSIDSGCSYEILLEGDQNSSEVKVSINNQLKPLPFIGFLSSIFGLLNDNNCFEIKVVSSQPTRPS